MLNRLRSHISGHVVGYLALFVALGGTSYGLASGSVDSREIKNNTIRTGDLRNNQVRSRDIRNRTIVGRDLLSNTLGGDQIDETDLGEVPLATRAESADNALALGGVPATAIARTPAANTVDIGDGEEGTVLVITGFGTLRVTAAGPAMGCDASAPSLDVDWLNQTSSTQEVWTSDGAYDDVLASGNSNDFTFDGYLSLRVGQQGDVDRQATIDIFFQELSANTECRVSAQAVTSG